MRKLKTAPERLELLLPWLNVEPYDPYRMSRPLMDVADIRSRLRTFVESFDGSEDAGYLAVPTADYSPMFGDMGLPQWTRSRALDVRVSDEDAADELQNLHQDLALLLGRGFDSESDEPAALTAASLSFGVVGRHRSRPTSRRQRHLYQTPGAYALVVDATLSELVPFLTAHLLTMPGAVTLARCPAPVSGSRGTAQCGNFFIKDGPGRPRMFCSDACRVRSKYAKDMEEIWKEKDAAAARKRRQRTQPRRKR